MELIQGCRDRDEIAQVRAFVAANLAEVVYPSESVCDAATGLLEEHALPRGLRVIDALIAATALARGARLATANVKHYRTVGRLRLFPFRPGTGSEDA
jgi:predicted nucleic acid-binding protein